MNDYDAHDLSHRGNSRANCKQVSVYPSGKLRRIPFEVPVLKKRQEDVSYLPKSNGNLLTNSNNIHHLHKNYSKKETDTR